jgi:hypothetical protein
MISDAVSKTPSFVVIGALMDILGHNVLVQLHLKYAQLKLSSSIKAGCQILDRREASRCEALKRLRLWLQGAHQKDLVSNWLHL